MDLNISRVKKYIMCKEAAFQNYHQNRQGKRSMNLVDGGAYHKGFAVWQATRNWELALNEARKQFESDLDKAGFDIDLDFEAENHWQLIVAMLEASKDKQERGMQIIQPEAEFCVDIPNSYHNDITVHWIEIIKTIEKDGYFEYAERWGMPTPEAIREKRVYSPHGGAPAEDCACWQPHRLRGKCDGILMWNVKWWLQEHKTTAILGEMFEGQWYLDIQLTAYVYAIWKSLGTKPAGVILNAIKKPSEKQVTNWNNKRVRGEAKTQADYIEYHRFIYERTEQDCLRFESQFKAIADEWERDILEGTFTMRPLAGHCYAYNRKCDYHDLCLNHEEQAYVDDLYARELDYVDEARQEQLIQIQGITA